jgi:malonyl-CoA O-methyltransferase
MIDKAAIAARFSQAAPTYDRSALVQRMMADRLTELLPKVGALATVPADPGHDAPYGMPILELGCGTGLLTERLLERYPKAFVHAIDLAPGMIEFCRRRFADHEHAVFLLADAEQYVPAGMAALVASNCAFQWFADPRAALENVRRRLAPGGWLAVGALLAGSLAELAESYEAASGRAMPALELWDGATWNEALARAGLAVLPASRVETLTVGYDEPREVLRGLKEIGATLGAVPDAPPLSPAALGRLEAHYRDRFSDAQTGRVRATYRAYFILAQAE